MKKLIGLMLVAALIGITGATSALADQGAGCGLGKQVWAGQSGMVAQVLAAITNNTISPASTSITSGTSGCDANGVIYRTKEQSVFVAVNLDALSQDMAQGHGASLDSLAALMGCSEPAFADFARMTHEKYGVLFGSAETTSQGLLNNLKREMATDPTLSRCTRIS